MKAIISTIIFIFFSPPLYSQLWKQYADSAKAYSIQKNADKAIEFYDKAKEELKKDSAATISYAQICDSIGILYYQAQKNGEAEKYYLEAMQIQEKVLGKEHPDYAKSCMNLGILYEDIGKYEEAERLLMEAKQIQEKVLGKEHPDYAKSCNNLGILYYYTGQLDKAEQFYTEAKQIREKMLGKDHPDYARACNNLGLLYIRMGQLGKAEELLLETKRIEGKTLGKDHPDYARCCNNLAIIYKNMGQFEKAEQLYLEAKQIEEKALGKKHPTYAISCLNLANLYNDMGHYEMAEPLYLEAKQIYEKLFGKEHQDYATTCMSLGSFYENMGQYEKAEQLYLEAHQILEKVLGKEDPEYAVSGYGLANLYKAKAQFEKAEPLLVEAQKIIANSLGKEHAQYANACNNLALLYESEGQYEKAEPLLLESKNIDEKLFGKEHPDYSNSCYNLASVYINMRQYQKAEPLLVEAKQTQAKVLGKHHPDYGSSCYYLANLYWLLHKPMLADKEFKESFSVNAFNVSSVFQFTNETEKASFIKKNLGEDEKAYSFYVSIKLKSGLPYSISLFHRNLILSSSQELKQKLFNASNSTIRNKYDEWAGLKRHLSILYSRPVNERKENVAKIEEKAGLIEKELTRISSGFKKQQKKIGWKDIRDKLKPDEASIEFESFHFNNSKRRTDSILYVALVLKKDAPLPVMVFLFNEKKLSSLFASTGNETVNNAAKIIYASRGASTNGIAANKSIYDLVWKPLEKELKGINTIYFAPSGMLHRIAFAALPISKNEVLSDRYKLVQLASTASVTGLAPTFITHSDSLKIYGGIKYDAEQTELKQAAQVYAINYKKEKSRSIPDDAERSSPIKYLPGTEAEIKGIEKQARASHNNVSVLSGISATEESFKALDGKASPAVIHIATHGFFFREPKAGRADDIQRSTSSTAWWQSENPMFRSGLLFAGANIAWQGEPIEGIDDGILTAYEVSNMYLPNTKLVVLSACETALGDIQGSEGVYGLQRAFKIAGVQNLVMSLWKVPDITTSEFMQEMYKNIFAGKSISDAFYLAQTAMKSKYRNDPYKWAAWVLVQ